MQGKRKGLLALWMVWVLLLTTVSAPVGADGTDIAVKLYNGATVLKTGVATDNYEMGDLSPGMVLDGNQVKLARLYGTDLKGNCPDGYIRDGWRIWKDELGLAAGRWIGDTDVNWASYLTGYFDWNNDNVMLAPNWVPEYAAGKANSADGAAVIKKVENGAVLVNGNTVADGNVEADGSVKTDGTTFHFQWLHEYKLVEAPVDENQIKGTVSGSGDYYDESTCKWMKGNGELGSLEILCELQAGDVVMVRNIGRANSDIPYYFNGYLWNEDSFSQTYFETYDKENKVFYAVVPNTGKNYKLCLRNMNNYMEINASVSVFRQDSTVAQQTSAVYTGDMGTYCCQISYEKNVMNVSGQLEKKTFQFLSDIVTVDKKYEITNVCGENGSCHVEIDGIEVYGPEMMAAPGQTVTIKAVPANGYEEGVISIKKTGELSGSDVPYTTTEDEKGNKVRTFTMPNYPVTVSASFAQKVLKTYTVTLPEGKGYIAAVKSGASSSVTEGKTYSFTVTVEPGYEASEKFRVLANGIELKAETDNPYTYTIENITSDQVITVEGIREIKDTEEPIISGVEEGKEYYGITAFHVEAASFVKVWVDGKQIQSDKDGIYTIQPDNESHLITVMDESGNTASCTIVVYETWVRDGIANDGDYSLKNGIGYKLGSGSWKVSGDDTIYAGQNTFYVPMAKKYTLVLQGEKGFGIMAPFGYTFLN